MMTATLDIATVQAFLLVAELQSFTRAAEALGTTQAGRQHEAATAGGGARQTAGRTLAARGAADRRGGGVSRFRARADAGA